MFFSSRVCVASLMVLLCTNSILATTIHYVTPNGSGNTAGIWTHSSNLHFALNNAVSGDEIWVAAGNYFPGPSSGDSFSVSGGLKLLGGFEGTETAEAERNWSVNQTILSGKIGSAGKTDNIEKIVVISGNNVRLDGFFVENSYGLDAHGIYAYQVNGIAIQNCVI
jgi:hypothetical protein